MPSQYSQHVLVVDDQRPFQLMMKGILYSLGYRLLDFAYSGEQALQRCQQQQYQIVFIDYNLGSGKNGRQLLEDLHQFELLAPDSICMLVTGENTVPMVISAVELEPDDYLIKPFSQSVLRSRLQRIQQKKQQLLPLYQAMADKNWLQVRQQAQQLAGRYPRHQSYLRRTGVQALLHLGLFDEAEQWLQQLLQDRRPAWAMLQHARIAMERGQHQSCQSLCQEALSQNRYLVEAYDLQSESLARTGNYEEAQQLIKTALEISPYQLQRLQNFFQLSLSCQAFTDMLLATRQMYELTKRAGQNDPKHLLNYVRSLLNAISQSEEASQRNRLQQESILLLHRAKRDEHLLRKINYELFEQLCMARLESVDGRIQQAWKSCQQLSAQLDPDDPVCIDLVMLLNQLGEFEEAQTLASQLPPQSGDEVLQSLLRQQAEQLAPKQQSFKALSRLGHDSYQQQDYLAAVQAYEQALQLAPMNSATLLNLLQSLLQAIPAADKHQQSELWFKTRQLVKQIAALVLTGVHLERFQMLAQQYDELRTTYKIPI